MLGLAHRGYRLRHPERHIVNVLRDAGYWTGLVGEQHVSEDPGDLGYDHVADLGSTRVSEVAPAATRLIATRAGESAPFFLSVGFFETHREFFEPSSIRDVLYSRPPENIPDNAQTRRDMASFRASARSLDQGVGTVLNALEEHGLADDTLVILTTDHGLAYPDAKCTMYDRGIGVMLMIRGPGGFERGRVYDAQVSHLDLYPTICDVVGLEHPPWLEGTSLLPLVRGDVSEVHEEIFAEVTYHAAYEPQRAVRTQRYKYMRRYNDQHPGRVLANVDDSLTKDVLLAAGWADVDPPWEALFDLWLDPAEGTNRVDDPALAGVARGPPSAACTTGWCGPGIPCSTDRCHRRRARSSTPSTRSRPATPRHRRRRTASRTHIGPGRSRSATTEAAGADCDAKWTDRSASPVR